MIPAQCPSTALGPPSAQSPFAARRCYRRAGDVQHLLVRRYSHFIAPMGSCARPVALPPASALASHERSLQVAVSPCWAQALPDVTSADLSPRVWTTTPAAPKVHVPVSSPEALAFPEFEAGRRFASLQQLLPLDSPFRSCSHSLMFRPMDLLATPVAPTSRLSALSSRGFYVRAYHGLLPPRAADMLTAQIRAIGGNGTRTRQNRQPCRLLLKPW